MIVRAVVLAALLFGLSLAITHADEPVQEPDTGNLFLCSQHALAAEGRFQPPAALRRMARVLHTKGECFRDRTWLSSYTVAVAQLRSNPANCIRYYQCQAYFLFDTIDPAVREPLAQAAYAALTEAYAPLFHFDGRDAPYAAWWFDPSACPNGITFEGDFRFC